MNFFKRLLFLLCPVAFCFFMLLSCFSMPVRASYYENKEPFSDLKFSFSNIDETDFYDYDYYLLLAMPVNSSAERYKYCLFFVKDALNEGVLKFHTDVDPFHTKISDLNYTVHKCYSWSYASNDFVSLDYNIYKSNNIYYGFAFDNYNLDKFPVFDSKCVAFILASNVDIYDYNDRLLQFGNYDTFLKYFDYNLNPSKITDFTVGSSSSESSTTVPSGFPDTTVTTTSADQTEVSNNILTNIKNIIAELYNLPQKIADKIGIFINDFKDSVKEDLNDLKNMLLDGLKALFVPSDNLFIELEEVIKSKFKFVYQILDFGKILISAEFLDIPPDNKITIYGQDIVFMDWTLYNSYKSLIDAIIIFCSYYFYVQRLIKRIPGIIGGFHT